MKVRNTNRLNLREAKKQRKKLKRVRKDMKRMIRRAA